MVDLSRTTEEEAPMILVWLRRLFSCKKPTPIDPFANPSAELIAAMREVDRMGLDGPNMAPIVPPLSLGSNWASSQMHGMMNDRQYLNWSSQALMNQAHAMQGTQFGLIPQNLVCLKCGGIESAAGCLGCKMRERATGGYFS